MEWPFPNHKWPWCDREQNVNYETHIVEARNGHTEELRITKKYLVTEKASSNNLNSPVMMRYDFLKNRSFFDRFKNTSRILVLEIGPEILIDFNGISNNLEVLFLEFRELAPKVCLYLNVYIVA